MEQRDEFDFDVTDISPLAWRLLRTAAGYEQRAVEKQLDNLMQAHISMLENDTRSLSVDKLEQLYDLYANELEQTQIAVLVDHF